MILQLRLYALYGLNRKVMVMVGLVFVATVISSTTIMVIVLANVEGAFLPPAHAFDSDADSDANSLYPTVSALTLFSFSFCDPLNLNQFTYFYAFWIPIMVCESLLCLLVILKAVHGWKRQSNLLDSGKEIIAVLIRDSVIYFVVCVPYSPARDL